MGAMTVLPSTVPGPSKRKQPPTARDGHSAAPARSAAAAGSNKKPRVGPGPGHLQQTPRLTLEPHEHLLAELRPRYHVAAFSVISSTSMCKRIDQILAHLGRFHPADLAVLPGVALLHARCRDAAKMVSLAELVRRRIHESGQKWWQYNRLCEVEVDPEGPSVIEETVLPPTRKDGRIIDEQDPDEDDGDAFEVSAVEQRAEPSVFERAVMGRPPPGRALYMSVFISRVPIPELKANQNITEQTNSAAIDQANERKFN